MKSSHQSHTHPQGASRFMYQSAGTSTPENASRSHAHNIHKRHEIHMRYAQMYTHSRALPPPGISFYYCQLTPASHPTPSAGPSPGAPACPRPTPTTDVSPNFQATSCFSSFPSPFEKLLFQLRLPPQVSFWKPFFPSYGLTPKTSS